MSDDQATQDTNEVAKTDDTSVVTDANQGSDEKESGEKSHEDMFYPDQKDEGDDDESKEDDAQDDAESDDDSESDDESSDDKDSKDEQGEYKLAKPKDSRLSDADMERIESYAKDQGLSKEAAEKLVENQDNAHHEYIESLQAEHKQVIKQWVDDVRTDKELGGEKFGESAEYAKSVVDRFGTDKFREYLNDTGYGNNPEVVRIFARIGKAMAPDTIVKEHSPSTGQRSLEDVFYPNSQN
jgi:hypothetical protein